MCYHPIHKRKDSHEETLVEIGNSFLYYWEQVLEGAWLKAILATVSTVFLEFFRGDLHVLYIYLGVAFLDLFLGRKLARMLGLYDWRKMKFWAIKQFTHLLLILLVGAVGHATFRTSGWEFSAANWMLLFMVYVEAASIEDKLKQLGFPVHPLIHKIFCFMRKKAVYDFSRLLDDPDIRKDLEIALESRRSEDANRQGVGCE